MGKILKWFFYICIAFVIWVFVSDRGTVSLKVLEPRQARYRELSRRIERDGVFQSAVTELDEALVLPVDLTVEFDQCGEANAFYEPQRVTIRMCYELVEQQAWGSNLRYASDSVASAATYQAALFVFYHEVAHALIHIFALPITGREEDAADQLAAWVLLEAGSDGRDAALQGALWFSDRSRFLRNGGALWDDHSLNQQRYFNLLCWVYGSDPQVHAPLLTRSWGLPRERAANCEFEYDRLRRAWNELLAGRII
jgi:hypothetical protein